MKANVKIIKVDSRNSRMELRAGEKGTGKVLWACDYWPDSYRSEEEADRMLADYCQAHSIELIPLSDEE